MTAEPRAPAPITPARLETLADGVFAIAMTLLVFDLKVPDASAIHNGGDLAAALWSIRSNLVTFVMSFIVMGIYWVGHHNMFSNFRRVDRPFLWLNIGFLFLIALLPFTTAVLGQFYVYQPAVALYGVHLVAVGGMFFVILGYATRGKRLVDADFDANIARYAKRRILIAPTFALLAILVSFVSPTLAFACFFLPLVPVVIPGPVDKLIGAAPVKAAR
ncbi:MAG: TMEM175 family protein [Thermoplasmatota archaeon]